MTLLRRATQSEIDSILEISSRYPTDLSKENLNFYKEKLTKSEKLIIDKVLFACICGYSMFRFFQKDKIAFDYNWDYEQNENVGFIGLGSISLNELQNGFETEEDQHEIKDMHEFKI